MEIEFLVDCYAAESHYFEHVRNVSFPLRHRVVAIII